MNDFNAVPRRCFALVSITTGTRILAASWIVGAIITYIVVFDPTFDGLKTFIIIREALELIAVALVFIACRNYRCGLMIPIIGCTIFNFVSHIVELFTYFIQIMYPQSSPDLEPKDYGSRVAYSISISAIQCVLSVWYFTVFKNCFYYLKEIQQNL